MEEIEIVTVLCLVQSKDRIKIFEKIPSSMIVGEIEHVDMEY